MRWLLTVVPLLITVATIVDVISIDGSRVKGLPKWGWVSIAILLSIIGTILWLLLGREPRGAQQLGRYRDPEETPSVATPRRSGPRRAYTGPLAPDDDPEFLDRLRREQAQRDHIRDLEDRLSKLEGDDPAAPAADGSGADPDSPRGPERT